MTDLPDDPPPHVTVEFVGGPFCGAVVDNRSLPLRAGIVRRLLSAARSDHPAELRLRQPFPSRTRVGVGGGNVRDAGQRRHHRYRLEVELGFAGRVLFRAVHVGTA